MFRGSLAGGGRREREGGGKSNANLLKFLRNVLAFFLPEFVANVLLSKSEPVYVLARHQ